MIFGLHPVQAVAGVGELVEQLFPLLAKDGLAALELLPTLTVLPDIILLDMEMPRMDGFEFLTALRGTSDWQHIPVIMITSRAGEKHRTKALQLGASDYIVKPYQDETLWAVIQRLTRSQSASLMR